jgi:hypothetical protein
VRLLEGCEAGAAEIDHVEVEWTGLDAGLPVDGLNGVLSVQQIDVVGGVATVTFAVFANVDAFVDGFFGPDALGIEVTLDGRTNSECAVLGCGLESGGTLNLGRSATHGQKPIDTTCFRTKSKACAGSSRWPSRGSGAWKFSCKSSKKSKGNDCGRGGRRGIFVVIALDGCDCEPCNDCSCGSCPPPPACPPKDPCDDGGKPCKGESDCRDGKDDKNCGRDKDREDGEDRKDDKNCKSDKDRRKEEDRKKAGR